MAVIRSQSNIVRLHLITTGLSMRSEVAGEEDRARLFRRLFHQSIIAPLRLCDCRHCDNRSVVVESCHRFPADTDWPAPYRRCPCGLRTDSQPSLWPRAPVTRAVEVRGAWRLRPHRRPQIHKQSHKLINDNSARIYLCCLQVYIILAIKHTLPTPIFRQKHLMKTS